MVKSYVAYLRDVPLEALPAAFKRATEESPQFIPGAPLVLWAYKNPARSAEAAHRDWIQSREAKRLALPEPSVFDLEETAKVNFFDLCKRVRNGTATEAEQIQLKRIAGL